MMPTSPVPAHNPTREPTSHAVPSFGIITPTLNAQDCLTACAASVQTQVCSFPHTHWILDSSRSTHSCKSIAQAYGCHYQSVSDISLYDAIQQGLTLACQQGCEWLAWINADEQVLPGAFQAVAQAFQSNPSLDLVFGNYLLVSPSAQVLSARREIPARRLFLRHGVNYLLSCTVYFRASLWQKLKGFDLSYHYLADKKFYLAALESGAHFAHLNAFLGAFGVCSQNLSQHPEARLEQQRLRTEIHGFSTPLLRMGVRALRCSEKLLRGCYLPRTLSTTLFDPAGNPVPFTGCPSTRWKWNS